MATSHYQNKLRKSLQSFYKGLELQDKMLHAWEIGSFLFSNTTAKQDKSDGHVKAQVINILPISVLHQQLMLPDQ